LSRLNIRLDIRVWVEVGWDEDQQTPPSRPYSLYVTVTTIFYGLDKHLVLDIHTYTRYFKNH
jgi:hypothetical protein